MATDAAQSRSESKRVRDAYIDAARLGDTDAAMDLFSPNALEAHRDLFSQALAQVVVPFFQRNTVDVPRVTETGATDTFGNHGYAYYTFAAKTEGGDPQPYAIWTVYEDGRFVIANVMTDQFFQGRHGHNDIPAQSAPPVDGNWLPGMNTQTSIKPALPEGYFIVPLVESDRWNLQDGVAWCAPESAAWVRGIKDKARQGVDFGPQPELPLITAWLSSTVGYFAETDTFSVEEQLNQAAANNQEVTFTITRSRWGPYPVLAYTTTNADGDQSRTAWVGINSGTWVIELNCNLPGKPADEFFWNVIKNSGASE